MDIMRTQPFLTNQGMKATFRQNRLLCYCLLIAFGGHLVFAGVMWGISHLKPPKPIEPRIKIAIYHPPKDEPKPKELPKTLEVPLGQMNGKVNAKMPKGTTLKDKTSGASGRVLTSGPSVDGPGIPNPTDALLAGGGIGQKDLTLDHNPGHYGISTGTGDEIPAGFAQGKIGGRVYFMRLKYGSDSSASAWNAHADGTRSLLKFLSGFIPCESETRAMEAKVLQDKFLSKGTAPCFIYIYADSTFRLNAQEVTILRDYIKKNDGFLFIDSAADPDTKACVDREMNKVLPGLRLGPIPKSHPINSFTFKITGTALGMNIAGNEPTNYGITVDGHMSSRLLVFYTMGDFSWFYDTIQYNDPAQSPGSRDCCNATYQMAANVIYYAINHGNNAGVPSRQGANATISPSVAMELIKAITGGSSAGGSEHHPKVPRSDKGPEDVNVLGD